MNLFFYDCETFIVCNQAKYVVTMFIYLRTLNVQIMFAEKHK